jgi:hypothetical protein
MRGSWAATSIGAEFPSDCTLLTAVDLSSLCHVTAIDSTHIGQAAGGCDDDF